MTIGEIAKITGLSIHTIRYYEKEGIIFPVKRRGGIRDFSETDLVLLQYIMCLKETGMPLDTIKSYINSCEYKTSCSKELIFLLNKQRCDVLKQITLLNRFVKKIDGIISCHSS